MDYNKSILIFFSLIISGFILSAVSLYGLDVYKEIQCYKYNPNNGQVCKVK